MKYVDLGFPTWTGSSQSCFTLKDKSLFNPTSDTNCQCFSCSPCMQMSGVLVNTQPPQTPIWKQPCVKIIQQFSYLKSYEPSPTAIVHENLSVVVMLVDGPPSAHSYLLIPSNDIGMTLHHSTISVSEHHNMVTTLHLWYQHIIICISNQTSPLLSWCVLWVPLLAMMIFLSRMPPPTTGFASNLRVDELWVLITMFSKIKSRLILNTLFSLSLGTFLLIAKESMKKPKMAWKFAFLLFSLLFALKI